MKKKDKIILAVLFVVMIIALIVVLGIMPTKDKIKKEESLATKTNTDIKEQKKRYETNISLLKKSNKELEELKNENKRNEETYTAIFKINGKDKYKKVTVIEALNKINSIFLKYDLPQLDPNSKTYETNTEGDLTTLRINLPDAQVGPYVSGFIIDSKDIEKAKNLNIIKKVNKLGEISEYTTEKLYWRKGNVGKFEEVAPNKLGGIEYKLRQIVEELNAIENSDIKIREFNLGKQSLKGVIIKEKVPAPAPDPNQPNPQPPAADKEIEREVDYVFSLEKDPTSPDKMINVKREERDQIGIVIEFLSLKK